MNNLDKYKIDTSYPGFYNDPNFILQEDINPAFLNEYNYYITSKTYTDDYLLNAKNKIDIVCKLLFEELNRENREGSCIDIAQALTKILEAEKIWCCIFTGSLTQIFSHDTQIDNVYFWLIDDGNYNVPHAWVYAPPYSIIDLSVCLQRYNQNEKKYLPNFVKQIETRKGGIEPIDIINPEFSFLKNYTMDGMLNNLFDQNPEMKKFSKMYEPQIVDYEKVSLKYIPIQAGASDGSLEQLMCISFSGKSPYQVYQERIKPELSDK
ncbi:hypothetical protein SAMN05421830_105164 [Desulfomicrobium norvegicum]|uniref:Uncharacterized protein n=1 Tax=Desulfomicrobium norvegicum (strain DSM 1741 / NCIMB 8310) TaxID=52561 RepID=A0A8G2C2W4_DESNO|nr:hypothetical protein [Desulfomicrobium norvegicum]SFL72384.1 hypothetical protein SAMN05421830_105164 [Desulfomicrobium norvegicum]